jgi:ubiquinone/menaquinone biosynthesis C-methylase UbiE
VTDGPTRAERQKLRDRETYDGVAGAFEQLSDRFTQPFAEWMVEAAEIGGVQDVLDVGTGTGIVALEAARRLEPGGRVLGIDLSQAMLARAEVRAHERGLAERVAFAERDAESLGLASCSQDRVLSLYALLHFPDPRAALAEMHRVLRPGGMLVLAIGLPPARTSLQGIAYAFRRLPLLVEQLRGRSLIAPAFLDGLVARRLSDSNPENASPVELPATRLQHSEVDASRLPGLLAESGFEQIRTAWDARLGVLASAGEFWDLQATFSSYARDHLSRAGEATPERVAALRQHFDECCAEALQRRGRLLYPYAAYYAVARRHAGPSTEQAT